MPRPSLPSLLLGLVLVLGARAEATAPRPGERVGATVHLSEAREALARLSPGTQPRRLQRELENARQLIETLTSRPLVTPRQFGLWLLSTSADVQPEVNQLRRALLREVGARRLFDSTAIGPLLDAAEGSDYELEVWLTRARRLVVVQLLWILLKGLFHLGVFLLVLVPGVLRLVSGPPPAPETPARTRGQRLWRRHQLLLVALGTRLGAATLVFLEFLLHLPGGIPAVLVLWWLARRERARWERARQQAAAHRDFAARYGHWADLYAVALHPLKNLLAEVQRSRDAPEAALDWLRRPETRRALDERLGRLSTALEGEVHPPEELHSRGLAVLEQARALAQEGSVPRAEAAFEAVRGASDAVAAWLAAHRLKLGGDLLEGLLSEGGPLRVVKGTWREQTLGTEDPESTRAELGALLGDLLKNSQQAGARTVTLSLDRDPERRPVIQVRDDGPGEDPAPGDPTIKAGTGLGAAQEWLAARGGHLSWGPVPGGGFQVLLQLPPHALARITDPAARGA